MAYTNEEKKAHHALHEYADLRLKNARTEDERLASEFVLKLLKKRLFSSPAAFNITLQKHVASVGGQKVLSGWQREISDYDQDYADDEQYESETTTADCYLPTKRTCKPASR